MRRFLCSGIFLLTYVVATIAFQQITQWRRLRLDSSSSAHPNGHCHRFLSASSRWLALSAASSEDVSLSPNGNSTGSTTDGLDDDWASDISVDDLWDASSQLMVEAPPSLPSFGGEYRSKMITSAEGWEEFMDSLQQKLAAKDDEICSSPHHHSFVDPFWEQVKLEAKMAVEQEPEAGPQLYQGILSQPSLLVAICTVISHEIQTELIPATALKNLFLETITPEDEYAIRLDLQAVATRSPSIEHAMDAVLFHNGFHALVCYRLGHRLWSAPNHRRALAMYMQSTVSRKYSADIHPACKLGTGLYVRVGAGVVIGETAVVGNDVSILEGVTLGGTGKEAGDRHPKVGNGVILYDGGTVLGNIPVGDGAIVGAKAIVTKPVPPLAFVSGVPAKIRDYRQLHESEFQDDLQEHLIVKYLDQWRQMDIENVDASNTT